MFFFYKRPRSFARVSCHERFLTHSRHHQRRCRSSAFATGLEGLTRGSISRVTHPRTFTWNLKGSPQKRKFLFKTIMFRFHVKFQGSMSGLIGKQHKTRLCLLGFRLGTLGVSSSESLRRDVHFFGFLNMGRGPFAEIDTTLVHGMQSFHWKICKGWLLHHYVGNKK